MSGSGGRGRYPIHEICSGNISSVELLLSLLSTCRKFSFLFQENNLKRENYLEDENDLDIDQISDDLDATSALHLSAFSFVFFNIFFNIFF